MITEFIIDDVKALNSDRHLIGDLKELNYFFGANGTGKTTVSRVLAHIDRFPACRIAWENGRPLDVLVYNHDFIQDNFIQIHSVKGIFSLGKSEFNILQKIEEIKCDIDRLNEKINIYNHTLNGNGDNDNGIKKQLLTSEETFTERCWTIKQKYDSQFGERGLEPYRGSKKRFKEQVLNEAATNNSDLIPLTELEAKAKIVFSETATQNQNIQQYQFQKILLLESSHILKKRIIGKQDIDIAKHISKWNNSDWVYNGITYYDSNEHVCPFCQQDVGEEFITRLRDYFDESFKQDRLEVDKLLSDYITESDNIKQYISKILNNDFIEQDRLESNLRLLESKIEKNIQSLQHKQIELSREIELVTLETTLNSIIAIIALANDQIDFHNKIILNKENEEKILKKQIWRFVIQELHDTIVNYQTQRDHFQSSVDNLQRKISNRQDEIAINEAELKSLESQMVSVKPTIDEINRILSAFGFANFHLTTGQDNFTYRIVRSDNSDALDTLSEGERNFLTFLYFYYLSLGSHSQNGISTNKILVIDDPVSSLDSDILFIVSSLIRKICENIKNKQGTIKQIFILTHNVYFFKEISYEHNRQHDCALLNETFWLFKKQELSISIESQKTIPVKTTYDLLWNDIRNHRNNPLIQNTLRRVLEYYFKLVGGIPVNDLYSRFQESDIPLCKALVSWIHDGSHSAFSDDHYMTLDAAGIDRYLGVFKSIFEHSGHIAHYNLMMGNCKV
jgi:wobble nucleotide-excising tRNase